MAWRAFVVGDAAVWAPIITMVGVALFFLGVWLERYAHAKRVTVDGLAKAKL
jgi:hypothetical protein